MSLVNLRLLKCFRFLMLPHGCSLRLILTGTRDDLDVPGHRGCSGQSSM